MRTRDGHPLIGKTVRWTHGLNVLVGPATHYDDEDDELFIVPDGLIHGHYWVPAKECAELPKEGEVLVSDEVLESQADYLYDLLGTKIFRTEWREVYKILMREDGKNVFSFFRELNTPTEAYGVRGMIARVEELEADDED